MYLDKINGVTVIYLAFFLVSWGIYNYNHWPAYRMAFASFDTGLIFWSTERIIHSHDDRQLAPNTYGNSLIKRQAGANEDKDVLQYPLHPLNGFLCIAGQNIFYWSKKSVRNYSIKQLHKRCSSKHFWFATKSRFIQDSMIKHQAAATRRKLL